MYVLCSRLAASKVVPIFSSYLKHTTSNLLKLFVGTSAIPTTLSAVAAAKRWNLTPFLICANNGHFLSHLTHLSKIESDQQIWNLSWFLIDTEIGQSKWVAKCLCCKTLFKIWPKQETMESDYQ